jgi:hypothetical protein
MVTILCALVSIFEFRVRSRASLELELIALRHQVTVLRRQRPGRPQLSSLDRLLWVWLYRIWPQVIDAMVLVKPATVVQWHRKGLRLYWRWRSRRPGRPKISTEIRDLIRRMSKANPLWGRPASTGNCWLSISFLSKDRAARTFWVRDAFQAGAIARPSRVQYFAGLGCSATSACASIAHMKQGLGHPSRLWPHGTTSAV